MDVMILKVAYLVLRVLTFLILVDVILTWVPSIDRWHPLVLTLRRITRPLYAPFQRLVPPEKTGNLDISPLLVIISLNIIFQLLVWILR